jgi:CHAT domain-containing protein/tetratricopeptide (TPR) repeat protein
MPVEQLIEQLLALPNLEARKQFITERAAALDDEFAEALKSQGDRLLRSEVQQSEDMVQLLHHTAEVTGSAHHRALGLRAEGNICCLGGRGEYQRACDLYDQAAELYREAGRPVDQAKSLVGKVWALSFMGRYQEALLVGEWIGLTFEQEGERGRLAAVTLNLGVLHGRVGDDTRALATFERARDLYAALGEEGTYGLAMAEHNRAVVLRNLGHFEDSLQASRGVWQTLRELGHTVEAARARQGMGLTFYVLGRYNEALEEFDHARDVFLADGRPRDAILADLFASDTLLQLRRFPAVLGKCQRARELFTELGTQFEVGQAMLNEAVAHAGLGQYAEAMASVGEARELFATEGNQVWVACTDLAQATLELRRGHFEQSLECAERCTEVFRKCQQPVREAQAKLTAAHAEMALGRTVAARTHAGDALRVGESHDIPALTYKAHHLLGSLAASDHQRQDALSHYDQAIGELERLRGRLMVEFRADFLEDKEVIYEDAVRLCLEGAEPSRALEYVERAKSRALLDLLAYRLDLSIQARGPTDQPLVDELTRLRAERDRWYRRWEGREEPEGSWQAEDDIRQRARQEVLARERQITDLWHRLLIRNADYARDAALWRVHIEEVQPQLASDTALLEYYDCGEQLIAFVVTQATVEAQRLPASRAQLRRCIQLLRLNLSAVAESTPRQAAELTANANGILQRLYQMLVGPLSPVLQPFPKWIVVPHGPLHYLPFHALHDGDRYVLESHELSYLPAASVLRFCREAKPHAGHALILGHSCGGRLQFALDESRAVAALLNGQAWVEHQATAARLRTLGQNARIVHLAAHGEFRPDNPLFSGLALDDGWLTVLDIFNLRMKASLVALSACETGRSVVGGGDELLGLTRALLHAGASSVVLCLWMVQDRCAAQVMEDLYRELVAGESKGAALRHAQLLLLQRKVEGDSTSLPRSPHPYFWAPFCLVGDRGVI